MISLILLMPQVSFNAPVSRVRFVDMSIESEPGASQSEVEITLKSSSKKRNFKFKGDHFRFKTPPGHYTIRVRSYDKRGIAGPWGEASDLTIGPKTVSLSPDEQSTSMIDPKTGKAIKKIKWPAAEAASSYKVIITNQEGKEIQTLKTQETEIEVELGIGEYKYTVVAISSNGIESEPSESIAFNVLEAPVDKPIVSYAKLNSDREISWKKPDTAKNVHYKLEHKYIQGDEWNLVREMDMDQESVLSFKDLKPGQYRVSIWSVSNLEATSEVEVKEFFLKPLERDLATLPELGKE